MTTEEKEIRKKELQKKKRELYKLYCNSNNKYSYHNAEHIDYVIDGVLATQIYQENPAEVEAMEILKSRGIEGKYQELIPIISEGGKLEHLYIADILIDKTVIEIDGRFHSEPEQQMRDFYREQDMKKAGYTIKRYSTTEVSKLKEDTFN